MPLGGRKIRIFWSGYNGITVLYGDNPPIFTDVTIIESPTGEIEELRVAGTEYPALEIYQYGGPQGTRQLFSYPAGGKSANDLLNGPVRLR